MKRRYCEKINLEEIDLEDRSFLFSFPRRDVFLLESIKNLGVLQPPIVALGQNNKLKIISGEGRIWACYHLNLYTIPCIVLENLKPKEMLLISLETNLFREINLVEKAEFLKKALPYFEESETLTLLSKLNLPLNYNYINFLLKINNLSIEFKKLLIKEQLNPCLVEFLEDLNEEEKKEFLEVLEKLRLTFSEQRFVTEKLLDYKKRVNLPSFLPEELREILKEEDFNKRKKKFLEKLEELYSPNFSEKKSLIKPWTEKLQKEGILIKFSPYFEKRDIEITFKFTTFEDYKNRLNFLQKNSETIKKILEII